MEHELIGVDALAARADVSPDTLRRWLRREGIDTLMIGDRRRRYVRMSDAETLLAPRVVPNDAGLAGGAKTVSK